MKLRLSLMLCILVWGGALLFAVESGFFADAEADSSLAPAPVIFQGRVIMNIYGNLGIYSPFERSVAIGRRLEELAMARVLYRDSLNMVTEEGQYTIRYIEKPIMSVTREDSLALNHPLKEIALAYQEVIGDEFILQFTPASLRQNIGLIVKTVLLVLLVLAVTVFLFWVLSRLIATLERIMARLKKRYPLGLVIRGIRFLKEEQFDRAIGIVVGVVRFVLSVLLLYFSLYFLLYVIPGTHSIALQLNAYLSKPVRDMGKAILSYLPNLFFIALVIIITRYVLRFLKYFFTEIGKGHIRFKNFYAGWAYSTYQIVRFLILFFVVVIIFPYLPGSGSPAFQGVSIFVGVLVSLGSSSAISNIIAGIILTYMRAFRVGDYVKIGDKQGVLIENSLLTLRIKTVKNVEISIPNSIALAGNIIDYSTYANEGNLILHTKVGLGYEVPSKQVEELLIKAALQSEGINTNKEPFVHIVSLKDYYVEYELNAYTDNPESMGGIYSELHRKVLEVFHAAGIEMVLPMYNAFRNGNESTIPPL